MFVQPPLFATPPPIEVRELAGLGAYATRYYDGLMLITRHWSWFITCARGLLRGKYRSTLQGVKVGECDIRKSLREQFAMLRADTSVFGTSFPTVVGEIGMPFDVYGKWSYGWMGMHRADYRSKEWVLDAGLNAGDGENMLNWTLWTYCPIAATHGVTTKTWRT
jgi:hypothetical protein